ncbi:hypothetical protein BH11MYX3_BH11MYX3_40870 [soil metagenome]
MSIHRVRGAVQDSSGRDIDQNRWVLLACSVDTPDVAGAPLPHVPVSELGGSGLRFELRVWIASRNAYSVTRTIGAKSVAGTMVVE